MPLTLEQIQHQIEVYETHAWRQMSEQAREWQARRLETLDRWEADHAAYVEGWRPNACGLAPDLKREHEETWGRGSA